MKPAPVDFRRPTDLAQALALLDDLQDDAMPIAGGQSLVPMMGLRLTGFTTLVDISRLDALRRVSSGSDGVFLGAATTHAMIEDGRVPDPGGGLMARVASRIAYRAVRNLGTIGGSVALADPAADWPCCMIALDARIRLVASAGTRDVAAEDFFLGPYETARGPGELIEGILIPPQPAGMRFGVSKVARKSGAFADSLAIVVRAPGMARVALGGTASGARLLDRSSAAVSAGEHPALPESARLDLSECDPDADGYRVRCHLATLSRAAAEALDP